MADERICPLCARPLGARAEAHHLIPRTYRGVETVALHPICHRKIHTIFTERELKDHFHTVARLLEHPDIRTFVKWIATRPPDFRGRPATSRALQDKRRR